MKKPVLIILILLAINVLCSFLFVRLDLTKDKKYTLSETTKNIINEVKNDLTIEVYLEGNFPKEIKRLQIETKQFLEDFKRQNSNINITFLNPMDIEFDTETRHENFEQSGISPFYISVFDKGKESQEMIFPWATVFNNKDKDQAKFINVSLFKDKNGLSSEEKIIASIQNLEFAFANAIQIANKDKQKKIAILKGNKQPSDRLHASFITNAREKYYIAPFTLDSVANQPIKSLELLKKYDLAVMIKPLEKFTDEEKQVLDQFIINGGKTLWMVDQVQVEMDSIMANNGRTLAYPIDLNLNDLFFKYGIRFNSDLVKDLDCAPIVLATGNMGNNPQYQQFPWFFSPLIKPNPTTLIGKNLDFTKFDFGNSIDILKNETKKTVLLQSSVLSKSLGTPAEIVLDIVSERDVEQYKNKGNLPMAVLVEGNFNSVFKNRVLPFEDKTFKESGKNNQMIVIADGDFSKNMLDKEGIPLETGFDKWTNKLYGNKEFLTNCIDYLMGETDLMKIKSKTIQLALLDKEKVYAHHTYIQVLNLVLPMFLVTVFGISFLYIKKRKYGTPKNNLI
jgi:gliding-associated putative ABC transporter substrate-binding component GldG